MDPASGVPYYYNSVTGLSTWQRSANPNLNPNPNAMKVHNVETLYLTRTRTRTRTLTKELAAEGEICDGYGRRISGKQLNQAAWRGRDIRAKAQAASAKAPVPLRNVKAPLGDRADLPPSRTSRSTPGSRGSKEMRV